jgi:hypothetical protein
MKAQNMVHRDLQAQNMLVRTNTASPQLVVMDFCWINWEGVPHQFSVVGRKLGRFTRAADWSVMLPRLCCAVLCVRLFHFL